MIDAGRLLADLTRLRADIEDDLRARCRERPDLETSLREEHRKASTRERTASSYDSWREDRLTQVAVAWILGCVFVRFLEDNALVDPPCLSGPGDRRHRALDEHNLYFRARPKETDREYLLHVFRAVASLPVAGQLFDERHNPLWSFDPEILSGDAATRLLGLWQRIDPDSGGLAHDFTDPAWDTRFLGDLYQDLSESARKRYALLQTPEFVEEFILDRTLDPAIEEFGFREVRLIDPACGSGHFLLGAFRRLDALWARHEPGTNPRERASRVLEQVAGVDLNPFAAAIARFRLCVAALRASDVRRLADAPAFELRVAAGDSLLHGPRPGLAGARQEYLEAVTKDPLGHVYRTEDAEALRSILGRRYHVVVGNPPYITPKDKALNQGYRERFGSCHRKYSLAVPFTERFFDLAHAPAPGAAAPAGFVGMITANSFMKREFGRKLIEGFIPRWDLSHVVDTSGAYIPGHGTPTVILFGRHRRPVDRCVRAVMGIRGEPAIPDDAAKGLVWSAIVAQVDQPGSQGEFVSVSDVLRERFREHPWSIGGGGAAELNERLVEGAPATLGDLATAIGRTTHTGEDDAFYLQPSGARTLALDSFCIPLVIGENVRDYAIVPTHAAVFPYDRKSGNALERIPERLATHFWRFRTTLKRRQDYGQTPEERGLRWFNHSMFFPERFRILLSITFPFVGTHNHFVLDRGGKVFKQSAPVVKLPIEATENDHLGLLGLLNSSTACFWMKQVFHNKGSSVDQHGARQRTAPFEDFWEHDGTKLQKFPVPDARPLDLARDLDTLAQERTRMQPAALLACGSPSAASLQTARTDAREIRERMIALQEELDWRCYRLYDVTADDLCMPPGNVPAVRLGERAFEIVLARKIAAGEVKTKWFERHGSTAITEIPEHWPAAYRALVRRRIEAIENNASGALIEQPEYKRRWNDEPWETQQERALRGWLLDRMEDPSLWSDPRLTTTAMLADRMLEDEEFLQVAELYSGRSDFDIAKLVAGLVENESVPLLSVLRYKLSGLRKRAAWERTWVLQRREDAIDARVELPASDPGHLTPEEAAALKAKEIGTIPVPPRYTSADFRKGVWWRLRGKLDVPKERFVSLPFCEREADPSLVVGWAGWNALDQSKAVAAYFNQMREQEGWTEERLTPLLAALLELLPWVRQYHNAPDPEFDIGMGDYFDGFIDDEARALSLTPEAIRAWVPPEGRGKRGRRKTST